jgi:hypothetical protein
VMLQLFVVIKTKPLGSSMWICLCGTYTLLANEAKARVFQYV